MKTLVVEDDISMRRLLETMLCSRGHEVIACSNAEAAWDAYQREVYSLVILSVDDLQLCRQMRGAPYGDQSVIVFLTVSRQPEELQMLLEAGADDYLIKPIEAEFLNVRLAIIEQQASKRIEHKRVEAALRESTATNRALLEAIPDAVFRLDKEGTFLDFIPKQGFKTLLPTSEFLGKKASEMLPPELAKARQQSIEKALQTGEVQIREYPLEVEGNIRHYESRLVACGTNELLAFVRDITQKKHIEDELRQANASLEVQVQTGAEQLKLVNRIAAEISSILDLSTLLNRVVRRFHSQDRWAVVGLVESDWLIFKSNDDDYGEIKGFQEAFRIPLGKGITGRVAATGKAELIADVSQDPDYVSIEGEPTRSECVLPLKIHGQTIGVLDVQSRKLNDFSDDDFQIYSSLATHLAIALDNALTHQRLRAHTKQIESLHEKRRTEYQAEIKRQQKLLEINHQANRQQSLSDTARVIVEGLRELGFDRAGVFIRETASEGVHGLWGTDSDGNIYQNEDEFLTTDDIPPTDGYYVEVDAPELKEIFGRGQSGGFLSRDRDDGIFESIWGYPPPCPGYYRRSEHGDNISLCAAVENERICIMAVDNHITKRQIDEVSANLLSLVATHLGQALANASLRESLEESEIRNQAMLTAIPDLMFRVSKDGVLLDYKTSKDNLAIAPDGLLGQNLYEVLPTEYARRTMHYMNQALQTGEVQIHEYQIALPQSSDNIRDFEARTVVSGEDETLTIVRDITEQKLAEAKIKASLKEKESLLQEIHHRVKNNLQIIISLLDLQLESRTDPKVLAALQGSQHRIRSMALVHEQLYQSENLAEIDFAQYIYDLVYNLFEAYQVPLNTITLKFSVDEISLDIDTAILCGLILNELVSNCLKYAFPMDGSNKVHIIFRSADSQGLTLIVRDNGIGFPNDLDFRETKSLGLQLVCTLTEQLAGTITLDRDNGTTFQITFSAKDQPIKSSLELLENED